MLQYPSSLDWLKKSVPLPNQGDTVTDGDFQILGGSTPSQCVIWLSGFEHGHLLRYTIETSQPEIIYEYEAVGDVDIVSDIKRFPGDYSLEVDGDDSYIIVRDPRNFETGGDDGVMYLDDAFWRFYVRIAEMPTEDNDATLYRMAKSVGAGFSTEFTLGIDHTGLLHHYEGDAVTEFGTGSGTLLLNRWYRIEISHEFSGFGATLTTTVKVDGIEVLDEEHSEDLTEYAIGFFYLGNVSNNQIKFNLDDAILNACEPPERGYCKRFVPNDDGTGDWTSFVGGPANYADVAQVPPQQNGIDSDSTGTGDSHTFPTNGEDLSDINGVKVQAFGMCNLTLGGEDISIQGGEMWEWGADNVESDPFLQDVEQVLAETPESVEDYEVTVEHGTQGRPLRVYDIYLMVDFVGEFYDETMEGGVECGGSAIVSLCPRCRSFTGFEAGAFGQGRFSEYEEHLMGNSDISTVHHGGDYSFLVDIDDFSHSYCSFFDIERQMGFNSPDIYVRFYIRPKVLPDTNQIIFSAYVGEDEPQQAIRLVLEDDGALVLYDKDDNTHATTGTLQLDRWDFIELRMRLDCSNFFYVTVRLNGAEILEETTFAEPLDAALVSYVNIGVDEENKFEDSLEAYFDDVMITECGWPDAGYTLRFIPDEEGDDTEWDGPLENVTEVPTDELGSVIAGDITGEKQLYFTNVFGISGTVNGVRMTVTSKTPANNTDIYLIFKEDGEEGNFIWNSLNTWKALGFLLPRPFSETVWDQELLEVTQIGVELIEENITEVSSMYLMVEQSGEPAMGVVCGGEAFVESFYCPTGGVVCSGGVEFSEYEGSFGGVVCGGEAGVFTVFQPQVDADDGPVVGDNDPEGSVLGVTYNEPEEDGGVVVAGEGFAEHFYWPESGVACAGEAFVESFYWPSGGVLCGSSASVFFVDFYVPEGGVKVGGLSIVNKYGPFDYFPTGEFIVIGGEAEAGITSAHFDDVGEIIIGGEASVSFTFYKDLTILWNTRAFVSDDLTFLWNTGRLASYWYRVMAEEKCSHDPCCQRLIMNVHARSLSELCEKISGRGLSLTILSVQKFKKPAENSVVTEMEAEGADFSCNEFEEIDLCKIPRCAEFCVVHDVLDTISFDITNIQINAVYNYVASGSCSVSGFAGVVMDNNLPEYEYESSGGIEMGGAATVRSANFTFVGGGDVIIGGEALWGASHWEYIGGVWPNTSGVRLGEETESLEEEETDEIWSLTERVLEDDGLFASTDISFGKTSEYLMVRGFNFSVPEENEILNIRLTVERKASQNGVQDFEIYLVVGDEIVSENLAEPVDWPAVAGIATYDFSGPWDIEDINAGDFGIAIRTIATFSTSTTIASVDYIAVEVTHEHPQHQIIRMGGEAVLISSGWSYTSAGGIIMDGTSPVLVGKKFKPTGEVVLVSGSSGIGFFYEDNSGVTAVVVGGSSDCESNHIIASGGVLAGGEAGPATIAGLGGALVSGEASITSRHVEIGTGGVIIAGEGAQLPSDFEYESTGGIIMGGEADRSTEHWDHLSDGFHIFVRGDAEYRSSDLGIKMEVAEFDMSIQEMFVSFGSDVHVGDAEVPIDVLSRCGCLDVPLMINLEHNLVRSNNLSQFLVRNGLSLPRRMELSYNVPNDSWQANLHLRGLSADVNTEEAWHLLFELQCTQSSGGIFLGTQIWRFSIEIIRENLTTGLDYDTRIVIGVLPDEICAANELKFKITLDTQTSLAEVAPDATIYQTLLYDNVGIFKNNSWINNPEVVFTISQAGLDTPVSRIDLTDAVLVD